MNRITKEQIDAADVDIITLRAVEQIREEALKRGEISDDAVRPFIKAAIIQGVYKVLEARSND